MTDHHHDELLGAYALHALDEDEQRAVEAHLAECPRCRAEAQALEEAATLLGNAGGDAPPEIWEAISQDLDGTPPPLADVLRPARWRERRRPLAVALGAAAAVLLAFGLLAANTVRQDHRIDDLEQALAAARDTSGERTLAAALAAPGARQVRLGSTDGAMVVPAVVLPDGTAYLVGASMPRLAHAETYQLWGQTEAGYVSLAVVGGAPEVERFRVEPGTRALAVTAERQGGAPQPTAAPIVSGSLQ